MLAAAAPNACPDSDSRSLNAAVPANAEEDRLCAGCKRSVSSETGGVVVAFGDSLWHVECFKCAKCGSQVNADTNLLLLSDGSPVCANCYNCKVCGLPILDEAVMTGDDSYHAACFTCRSCKNRIDELVFAKTSQGFYCMKCHKERVARSRRHLARQKQKEIEKQQVGGSTSRSIESKRPTETETPYSHPATLGASSSRPNYTTETSLANSTSAYNQSRHQGEVYGSSRNSDPNSSLADASFVSTNSSVGASVIPVTHEQVPIERRSASPVPPTLSVVNTDPKSFLPRTRQPRITEASGSAVLNTENPPPPYSMEPPHGYTNMESSRSSASDLYSNSSGPVSPSLSNSNSHDTSTDLSSFSHSRFSDPSSSTVRINSSFSESESESSFVESRNGVNDPAIQRRSYEEGNKRSSTLLAPRSPAGRLNEQGGRSKRDKRGSINPGLQLEASKYLQFQSNPSVVPSSSQPSSPTISISAPQQQRKNSPTSASGGHDSHVSSPLRDYFNGTEDDLSHSGGHYSPSSSNSTSFYTVSSPSPQSKQKASQNLQPAPSPSPSASTISAPSSTVTRDFLPTTPKRNDSLVGSGQQSSLSTARSSEALNKSAQSVNGRLLPSSTYSHGLRPQRSFDERSGRLSPRKSEFGVETPKRSRSVSPKPPDVPKSIESGTDTEADNDGDIDDITLSYALGAHHDSPPPPPPKDIKEAEEPPEENRRGHHTEPSVQSVSSSVTSNTSESDSATINRPLQDQGTTDSSTVHRTSAFFLAPALPPMRFSMNGTDFREILNSLGDSSLKPPMETDTASETFETDAPEVKEEPKSESSRPSSSFVESNLGHTDSQLNLSASSPSISPLASSFECSAADLSTNDMLIKDEVSDRPSSAAASHQSSVNRKLSIDSTNRVFSRPSQDLKSPLSPRSSLGQPLSPRSLNDREKPESSLSVHVNGLVAPGRPSLDGSENSGSRPSLSKRENADRIIHLFKEAVTDSGERGIEHVKLDRAFADAILSAMEQQAELTAELSKKVDGMKRTSQMVMDGLNGAQEEYDQLLVARRNAEEEVSRLKIALSGQAARLTVLASEERKAELKKQLSEQLSEDVTGLERHLSKLIVERDMVLAEVEELSASKGCTFPGEVPPTNLTRSLTSRFESLKKQYEKELVPLTEEREALLRDISELKEVRNAFLEESAVLNARNEELAQLNAQYERRMEPSSTPSHSREKSLRSVQKSSFDTWRGRQAPVITNSLSSSTASSTTLYDESTEPRFQRPAKGDIGETPVVQSRSRGIGLRWPGNHKANKENVTVHTSAPSESKIKRRLEHAFQQISILRFSRCDHCGDKMWGSQVRCTACNLSVHVRCAPHVQSICMHDNMNGQEDGIEPPPPSMFGRDLVEQVHADARGQEDRNIPVIVEKCIDAVETWAMDYEGIYRKTGGSGQSKAITSLFERGDYEAFDLRDSDAFNDISSVTSVLKTYFRNLPNPLLTHDLHESFVSAAGVRDTEVKAQALRELVHQLPKEHYYTLARLMLHLHSVQEQSEKNLMNARNLGVIFGPTLMRSRDPGREFGDMAGKALTIEWLIENAPSVFEVPS